MLFEVALDLFYASYFDNHVDIVHGAFGSCYCMRLLVLSMHIHSCFKLMYGIIGVFILYFRFNFIAKVHVY